MDSTHWEWTHEAISSRTEVASAGRFAGDLWIGLHGLTGTGRDFEPWFQSFSRPLFWEAPDLPGHGGFRPSALEAAYAMAGCGSMLKTRLDAASESMILVGYSMGGRIALNFALSFGHRLKGLVLIGANPGIEAGAERDQRVVWETELCERLNRQGTSAFLSYWQSLPIIATQKRIAAPIWEMMQNRRQTLDALEVSKSIRGLGTGRMDSMWQDLAHLKCPLLFCAGQQDPKYCEIGKKVVERVPQGELAVIPGAGHAAHLEGMGDCVAVVEDWYGRI